MSVDKIAGELSGMFVREEGMDARIGADDREGRRIVKVPEKGAGSSLYLMATVSAPFFKIGWVRHRESAAKRLELLQVGCPYQLQLLATFEVPSRRSESVLHKAFRVYHFRGEWFRAEGRLKAFAQMAVAFPELSLDELVKKAVDRMSSD